MAARGKKYLEAKSKLDTAKHYSLSEGLELVAKLAYGKFDESLSIDASLGIDPTKGDQVVRGSVVFPNGSGKQLKVLALVSGENEALAKSAGADFVGLEDYMEKIKGGWLDFDVAITTPDLMVKVSSLAKILGPKGKLPNKKNGTVTDDLKDLIGRLKSGQVFFRNDKGAQVHMLCGRLSFGVEKLAENCKAAIRAIVSAKPSSSKGVYLKKVVLSSTLGVGVKILLDSF